MKALIHLRVQGLKLAERYFGAFILQRDRLVTDAEVLQEILHRYAAIKRLDAMQPAFDALLGLVDEIFPVDAEAVDRAKIILLGKKRISARNGLHVAVMEAQGISQIMSFDSGFDGIPGIVRVR